jgi:hypothetical protein
MNVKIVQESGVRAYITAYRYSAEGLNKHERDAFAVARWLKECDQRGILDHYFHPPLTEAEAKQARREGWILGVC